MASSYALAGVLVDWFGSPRVCRLRVSRRALSLLVGFTRQSEHLCHNGLTLVLVAFLLSISGWVLGWVGLVYVRWLELVRTDL